MGEEREKRRRSERPLVLFVPGRRRRDDRPLEPREAAATLLVALLLLCVCLGIPLTGVCTRDGQGSQSRPAIGPATIFAP